MVGESVEIAVVGGGIAGLAAACELERAGREVVLLEAASQPGGVIQSERARGFLFERGPNTLHVKPALRVFLESRASLSLLQSAAPAARRRWLYHNGKLEAVPMGPWAFARTPLLSLGGKLRLLAEPCVRRGDGREESADAFARRRFGCEVAENLVGPFLTGIYAGDERRLGAQSVFGSLVEFERERGSVLRGWLARRRAVVQRELPGIYSSAEGLSGLSRALAAELKALCCDARAVALRACEGGFELDLRGREREWSLRCRSLVLALPAYAVGPLLRELDAEAAEELLALDYAPIVSISLAVSADQMPTALRGFGFLVPRQARIRLLGTLFMSQLFPERAPVGRELLTCMLGGLRWPAAVTVSDTELRQQLFSDLERVLGLRGEPELLALIRWPRAVPQPGPQHPQRVADVRARLAEFPGLLLAGASFDGVSIADALASGVAAAEAILARS